MRCGGGVCSPGGRSSTSWPGRWRHSREAPGRSRRITRSATPSATTATLTTRRHQHTRKAQDANKRCRRDSEQGTFGQKTRIGMRTSRWPTLPRQHNQHSRVPHAHKRAARGRVGTELLAPGKLLQKHRCLVSGRVRGRARRVARALVASVGACDTRGVWRTRVPRPCTCAASGPRAYVGLAHLGLERLRFLRSRFGSMLFATAS